MRVRALDAAPPEFPDESNTGPSGALTPDSGNKTFTTDGAVYEDMDLFGSIFVDPGPGETVTIRNCRIESQAAWGILVQSGTAIVEDCYVHGNGLDPAATGCIHAQFGAVVHIERCNLELGENGVRLASNSTLRDSYIHSLFSAAGDPHYDGVEADGKIGVEITGNTILNEHPQTSVAYVGDILLPDESEVLFANNYVAGGGFTLYSGEGAGLGIRVLNNKFSTQYFPDCGNFGYITGWVPSGNTWSGNEWIDGPNAGLPVEP